MTVDQLKRTICTSFLIVVIQWQLSYAQEGVTRGPIPNPETFFSNLVEHYSPATLPKYEDVLKVTDQIAGERPEDITKALPAIFTALAFSDGNVKSDAAIALFAISLRPDSAAILGDHVNDISSLFSLPNGHLQNAAVGILSYLRPSPPQEVVPVLLGFAKQTDRDQIAQGSAVSVLLKIAPTRPDVVSAVQGFLARPLTLQTKEGVLNGIASSHTTDQHLVQMLITALDDPNEGIRFTAAQGFQRMPKEAVLHALPALQRLAVDSSQSAEVKAAASVALQKVR